MKKIGDLKLDGHPEAFQFEQNGSRIFINVPTAHQVAIVDHERMTAASETYVLLQVSARFGVAVMPSW